MARPARTPPSHVLAVPGGKGWFWGRDRGERWRLTARVGIRLLLCAPEQWGLAARTRARGAGTRPTSLPVSRGLIKLCYLGEKFPETTPRVPAFLGSRPSRTRLGLRRGQHCPPRSRRPSRGLAFRSCHTKGHLPLWGTRQVLESPAGDNRSHQRDGSKGPTVRDSMTGVTQRAPPAPPAASP